MLQCTYWYLPCVSVTVSLLYSVGNKTYYYGPHHTIPITAKQWKTQNTDQTLNSQQTPHSSPFQVSYGMSTVSILEKMYHVVMALHLIHLPVVLHTCIGELGQHWFRWRLAACLVPSHYQNQCWLFVNWTLRNKRQWNSNQNTKFFIDENTFEKAVCKMVVILFRGKWVNKDRILQVQLFCDPFFQQ